MPKGEAKILHWRLASGYSHVHKRSGLRLARLLRAKSNTERSMVDLLAHILLYGLLMPLIVPLLPTTFKTQCCDFTIRVNKAKHTIIERCDACVQEPATSQ